MAWEMIIAVGERHTNDDHAGWRSSSACNQTGNCVEVRWPYGSSIWVRDSKRSGSSPDLSFAEEPWWTFIEELRR
jgi:hypothetical protein